MFRKKSLGIIAMVLFGFLFAPSRAEANPIACQDFQATRSGDDVVLELLLFKDCYEETPAPEDTLLVRDLFVQDVDFELTEDNFSFYLTAVDHNVSSNEHSYSVSFDSYEGVSNMGAGVEGTECADLDVDVGAQEAVLVLSLKAECVSDPGTGLEYIVEKNYNVLEPLEWAEQETQAGIECTATHVSENDENYVSYRVGVRSEDDTYYASFTLPPHGDEGEGNRDPEGENDPENENENNGDQMTDGGSGCNMHGNTTPENAPFFLLLLAPLFFWRRRKSA